MITVKEKVDKLNYRLSQNNMKKLGRYIRATYTTITKKEPRKEKRLEGNNEFIVNVYPDRWEVTIGRLIKRYCFLKMKRAQSNGQIFKYKQKHFE